MTPKNLVTSNAEEISSSTRKSSQKFQEFSEICLLSSFTGQKSPTSQKWTTWTTCISEDLWLDYHLGVLTPGNFSYNFCWELHERMQSAWEKKNAMCTSINLSNNVRLQKCNMSCTKNCLCNNTFRNNWILAVGPRVITKKKKI